jgi:hypothetical protein
VTLLDDYAHWHKLQRETDDIDPVYPVYNWLIKAAGLTIDQAAWLVLLHVNYYHMGSALAAFQQMPQPGPPTPALLKLPTGVERRGHRDWRQMERHWLALLGKFEKHGGAFEWLVAAGEHWPDLMEHLADVQGNGRWAAYKTGEMTQKILGLNTVITDASHAYSTGPRKGLTDLAEALGTAIPTGNTPAVVAHLEEQTLGLARLLGENDIGYVETSLCDFHSLVKGGYYLGHDIDGMQEQLAKVPSDLAEAARIARAQALPNEYLGELHGRDGVDRERKTIYRDRGEIVVR